ncbi:MAG: phage head-tail connector protein [Dokdonella sp.]|uniref:head-tail connector protein n=1 Tax=Dokdonella sp. TaxID=2291710 RepID=UPI0025BBFA20|nr:phage head-tail connector protein [Dokdonella sp.]MBK8123926.1 phage head-tail connector protein [Dokdonella sp.]
MAGLIRTVAPADLPVDVATVKSALRIDLSDDDTLLAALIGAASDEAEHRLHRAILPQTWMLFLDSLPRQIRLPWPTAQSVTVEYCQDAGDWVALNANDVFLVSGPPSIVVPTHGVTWPTVGHYPDSVRVTFQSCSWETLAVVPLGIRQWIVARVGELYEYRERSGPAPAASHAFVDSLLAPWIIPDYGWRQCEQAR